MKKKQDKRTACTHARLAASVSPALPPPPLRKTAVFRQDVTYPKGTPADDFRGAAMINRPPNADLDVGKRASRAVRRSFRLLQFRLADCSTERKTESERVG